MLEQACLDHRDSKALDVFDESCDVPNREAQDYPVVSDAAGLLGQAACRAISSSMSEYGNDSQAYNLYDYDTATRPNDAPIYSTFTDAHHTFAAQQYAGTQAQVPTGLPQSTAALAFPPPAQHLRSHDHPFLSPDHASYSAYLDGAPRHLPEILSWPSPTQGTAGTPVTVCFRSIYDLDSPSVKVFLVFGQRPCETTVSKNIQPGPMYHYTLTADAPPVRLLNSPSSVPLHLVLDQESVAWQSPSMELGSFSYFDSANYYGANDSPQMTAGKKRKLSQSASPRQQEYQKQRVPPGYRHGLADDGLQSRSYALPYGPPNSPFRPPSGAEGLVSGHHPMAGDPTLAYACNAHPHSHIPSSAPSIRSPSWGQPQSTTSSNRSPAASTVSAGSKQQAHIRASTAESNPPLIRTSTLGLSPAAPTVATMSSVFNPYTIYPANAKAALKIEGDLNSMADRWTPAEWETKRRLVQFRRSQSGSIITTTFEAVTFEERAPNSICVSCIWWEERQECYVTSVDTISLLESLVAVRFTVEEKNRIRRNLEGFRPATVSKVRADSEDFFKLIMGFPNPKPRNIEKDVKVFPWRILATALKKIIGKYASHNLGRPRDRSEQLLTKQILQSASYSSTAGTLQSSTPSLGGYGSGRVADGSVEPRAAAVASPRSTSSSTTPRGAAAYAYANAMTTTTNAYSPHTRGGPAPAPGMSCGPLGYPAGLAGSTSKHSSWPPYVPDVQRYGRGSFDFEHGNAAMAYIGTPSATGLPGSAQMYSYGLSAQPRTTSLRGHGSSVEGRFVPLNHEYEGDAGQQTTAA